MKRPKYEYYTNNKSTNKYVYIEHILTYPNPRTLRSIQAAPPSNNSRTPCEGKRSWVAGGSLSLSHSLSWKGLTHYIIPILKNILVHIMAEYKYECIYIYMNLEPVRHAKIGPWPVWTKVRTLEKSTVLLVFSVLEGFHKMFKNHHQGYIAFMKSPQICKFSDDVEQTIMEQCKISSLTL